MEQQHCGRAIKHAPLRRVLPLQMANPQTSAEHHRQEHPLLFAPSPVVPHGNHQHQQNSAVSPKNSASHSSLADSCYSSCSEGEHLALSRETSDSSCASSSTTAQLVNEFGQKATIGQQQKQNGIGEHAILVEFATRLGFSQSQLCQALAQLGDDCRQDRVLAELLKLGNVQRSPQLLSNANCKLASTKNHRQKIGPSSLRPIVMDGCNIAMTHGNKTVFSCRGIRECVNFFAARGHPDILVFVPHFRREQPRPETPILDQDLVWTPSRRVAGRRIVCHDDRYILKTAVQKQAVIVSNDEYRDLVHENPEWRAVVDHLLLIYTFVDGKFMPPDDPLGRRGPKLDQFLTFAHTPLSAQPCPYARKCTYGSKCKYFHPERPNGATHVGVADRLIAAAEAKKQLATRPSLLAEYCQQQLFKGGGGQQCHYGVNRTQSLTLANCQGKNGTASIQPIKPKALSSTTTATTDAQIPVSNPSQPNAPVDPYLIGHCPCPPIRNVSAPSAPPFGHMFAPNVSIWGEREFALNPAGMTKATTLLTAQNALECQQRLQYHLCQIFPESAVLAVMAAHPGEMDAQQLFQRIIAFQKASSNNKMARMKPIDLNKFEPMQQQYDPFSRSFPPE